MSLMSPVAKKSMSAFERAAQRETVCSSSSEAEPRPTSSVAPDTMHSAPRTSHTLNYSGNDYGSFSDFSDSQGPLQQALSSVTSLPPPSSQIPNSSQQSNVAAMPDNDRVIFHGWLWVLKSKRGVRQWKKVWVVLRPKTLGLYKNGQEYSANLILPFASMIDAVDIDAASRSKQHCMQVISEEKNLRFCAADEDTLAKWLGAFKSLLVKRREAEQQRILKTGTQKPTTSTQPTAPKTNTAQLEPSLLA
jgi:hypothetical protein